MNALYIVLVLTIIGISCAENFESSVNCPAEDCNPATIKESGSISFNKNGDLSRTDPSCFCEWKIVSPNGIQEMAIDYSLGFCEEGDLLQVSCENDEREAVDVFGGSTGFCSGSSAFTYTFAEDTYSKCVVVYIRHSGNAVYDSFEVSWRFKELRGTVSGSSGDATDFLIPMGISLAGTIGIFAVGTVIVRRGRTLLESREERRLRRQLQRDRAIQARNAPGAEVVVHGDVRPRNQDGAIVATPITAQSMFNMNVHLNEVPRANLASPPSVWEMATEIAEAAPPARGDDQQIEARML